MFRSLLPHLRYRSYISTLHISVLNLYYKIRLYKERKIYWEDIDGFKHDLTNIKKIINSSMFKFALISFRFLSIFVHENIQKFLFTNYSIIVLVYGLKKFTNLTFRMLFILKEDSYLLISDITCMLNIEICKGLLKMIRSIFLRSQSSNNKLSELYTA